MRTGWVQETCDQCGCIYMADKKVSEFLRKMQKDARNKGEVVVPFICRDCATVRPEARKDGK